MESNDTYVYLRVFSDSTAECQPRHTAPEKNTLNSFKKTLTQDEFERIKSILDEPKVLNLRAKYDTETRWVIVDTWTQWNIKFQSRGQSRTITVLEFSPGLARAMKHPYPDTLVKLGCTIEKLRSDVSGELFLDSACKKVLGIH